MNEQVKVKLTTQHIGGIPGNTFYAYGHTMVVQPNGEAHGFIHQDFVKTELKSGRFTLVEDEDITEPSYLKGNEQDIVTFPKLAIFTFDIGTYYGVGDLEKLIKKIETLNKKEKLEFTRTRLSIELPETMPNKEIVEEIKKITIQRHQILDGNDLDSESDNNTKENNDAFSRNDGEG